MADEPAAEGVELEPEPEQEGGPVKSFLEHLEDLRWMLIKCITAAGVAILVCLLGGNYVVAILEWPLKRAPVSFPPQLKQVRVVLGTNQLGMVTIGTNDAPGVVFPSSQCLKLQLVPITVRDTDSTNQVFGFNLQEDSAATRARGLQIDVIQLSPAGAFIVATKVAVYAGLVLSSPFIFYFIAQFVFPALRMREKKYVYRGLAFGAGLFMTGVCFCYFVLMPIALAASVAYAKWLGFPTTQWRAEEYIGFVCKFMLGMGLGFELPVVVLTLVKIGILSYRMLAAARRYVIVISFILGAILTTPEVITQVLMAFPLLLLYEISVWIAWYWERQERKREATAD